MTSPAVTPEPVPINNRKDFLLLLLAAQGVEPAEPIVGVTRLQKYLFLLQEEHRWHERFNVAHPYVFTAYDYGPFDSQLYDDLALLQNIGFVTAKPAGAEPTAERDEAELLASEWGTADPEFAPWEEEPRVFAYSLTEEGREFVKRFEVDEEDQRLVNQLKGTWNRRPLNELLRWLYTAFPTYARNTKLLHLRPTER